MSRNYIPCFECKEDILEIVFDDHMAQHCKVGKHCGATDQGCNLDVNDEIHEDDCCFCQVVAFDTASLFGETASI